MRPDCYFCHIQTVKNLIDKFQPAEEMASEVIWAIHMLLSENQNLDNPHLSCKLHRIIRELLQNNELYAEEKNRANILLLRQEEYWRNIIATSDNPFHTAARMAVIGNIIDYGAHSLQGDLRQQIEDLASQNLTIDDSEQLEQALEQAESILYLGDNAGEIVFDKLFIETISHPRLTYAVRGNAVINDVTYNDAQQVNMESICHVITNGYDAPSTLLDHCSDEFLHYYKEADLIISKGQGNFEGLMKRNHRNTFFLLIAKCRPMGDLLGVKKGQMVITRRNFSLNNTMSY